MAIKRIGYGQVEPNQLSAQKTGQIYASLPLDEDVKVLQNGEFMFYDYGANMVLGDKSKESTSGQEPMLVFNEIKIYEDKLALKDFAMIRVGDNYVTSNPAIGRITSENTDGTVYGNGSLTEGAAINAHTEYNYRMDGIAPRLFKTNIGDIFTTNMVKEDTVDETKYAKGKVLGLAYSDRKTLVLCAEEDADPTISVRFIVAQYYTMPDGQPGIKVQRIK